jgi:hypothetical protein
VLGHGGQANATFTDFGFAPDRGIAWAASANLDNCLLPTRIGDHIKATALGVSRAAREEQPWSAAEVEELGGRWVVSGLGDAIVVERDGDAVMLRVEPAVGSVLARHAIPPPLRIVRYGEDRFNTPDFLDGLLTGRVLRDPDGRAWAIRTSGRVFSRG